MNNVTSAEQGSSPGYGPLGSTGLSVSRFGFGGYRVTDESSQHGEALSKALLEGANLVDTSTNYTDGGSERRDKVNPMLLAEPLS